MEPKPASSAARTSTPRMNVPWSPDDPSSVARAATLDRAAVKVFARRFATRADDAGDARARIDGRVVVRVIEIRRAREGSRASRARAARVARGVARVASAARIRVARRSPRRGLAPRVAARGAKRASSGRSAKSVRDDTRRRMRARAATRAVAGPATRARGRVRARAAFEDKVRRAERLFEVDSIEAHASPLRSGFRARASFGVDRRSDGALRLVGVRAATGELVTSREGSEDDAAGVARAREIFLRLANDDAWTTTRAKVAAVNFLTNRASDEIVIACTLSAESDDGDDATWMKFAEAMRALDDAVVGCVRRRKKTPKLVVGRDYVMETTRLVDGRAVVFKHVEGSFSNPNGGVAELTANHLVRICANVAGPKTKFIELYAGCGNHTCCVAPQFPGGAFAVEIDPVLVEAARENFARNGVRAEIVCRAAEDWIADRSDWRTNDRDVVLLVDPPRGGLDARTLDVVTREFDDVIYVACDCESLKRDIDDERAGFAARGFELTSLACFDHAPTSPRWIETVGVFKRRTNK